jgi:putative spermidine/putrescine transport system permease protein
MSTSTYTAPHDDGVRMPTAPAGGTPRVSSSRRALRSALTALPVIPALLLLGFAFVWPLGTIIVRSLDAEGRISLSNLTFDNYQALLSNDLLRQITQETIVLAVLATVVTAILAFPTAYLMSRLSRRYAIVLIALVTTPFWVSILVRLFAFTSILGREGVVNDAAGVVGLGPFDLLFNTAATVIGMVAYLLPYMILVLYAAMSSVDTSLMTAAKTMGASGRQAFLHIYLPQVRPAFVSGSMLIFVLGLGFFLTPAILGGPTNLTLPVYIQQQITIFQWGTASASGIALLVVSLVGYALALRIGGAGILAPGGRPVGRGVTAKEPLKPGLWTGVSWVFVVVVLLLLLVPLLIIIPAAFGTTTQIQFPPVGFTTHWFTDVLSDPLWTDALWKSVRVGLGTAVLSVAVALGLARTAAKVNSSAVRTAIMTIAFAPLIVPVVLLGIGVYDVQLKLDLVGTDIGLVLAHTVIAFPLAFIILSNSLSNIDGSLEPAAWSMGASRLRAFWTIVVPNLVPGLIGAFVIAFMTSWDEAVLALFQTGLQKTLPVTIYSFLKSGVSPAVGAVAVMLITPVVLAVIVTLVVGQRRSRRSSSTSSVVPQEAS